VAVSPMIAPTVGGYLTTGLGWPSVFIVLALVTMLMLVFVYFVLPEGRPADRSISLKPQAVLKNFYTVIKQPQFLIYCIAGGLAGAAPFAFIAGSPDVFMNIFHTSEREYGWIFAMVGAVIIGGAQMNHFLLRRFRNEQIVFVALAYQIIVGILLLAVAWFGIMDKTMLIILVILFLSVHGLTNSNAAALSLAPFSKFAGSAASLLGTFRMTMGAIVSALVSIFHDGTILPMAGVMVFCVLGGFLLLLGGKTVVKYQARNSIKEETPLII
jgi:MFS transporter, DHA1 family, multidrug resistance protein